jgi:hypothetical protein
MDEALHFLRIGTFLERADNTARLLDVKFQALAGGELLRPRSTPARRPRRSRRRWTSTTGARSCVGSGFEIHPQGLPQRHPPRARGRTRSAPRHAALAGRLHDEVVANLQQVANAQSGETLRRAGRLKADLQYGRASTRSCQPGCTPT